ncbi:ABC transporter permease [Planotetraspora mira]|uniref:Transporter n=1 Tax=Planotetraspora mira TaxID=58121 RepID=A0A8J3TMG1_9ACTN|nr:ABC transporter permease [Planotetraspora mira]GII28487.1 transporter [Planotetraspora mira]
MIWLTWRQLRTQAGATYALLAVLAVILATTGSQLLHLYETAGADFLTRLTEADNSLYLVGALAVMALPALIGMFWGAPLITRELDAGTHRLVWNQGVTRTRWLITKLGLTGLAAMAAAGALSLAVSWWAGPIDATADGSSVLAGFYFPRLSPLMFDARGVAPIGHAAFAFTLGVTLGVLIRRTLPAMIVTLVAFITVQVAVPLWVRPALIAPARLTTPISAANFRLWDGENVKVLIDKPGAWTIGQHTIDAAGRSVAAPSWIPDCLGQVRAELDTGCLDRLGRLGYRQLVSYQPAGRFWTFQWYELGIFLALAVLLALFCAWWIRRHVS